MNCYGSAGTGTRRSIAGFRNWHQAPLLNGLPERRHYVDEIIHPFFGDIDYAGMIGWPDMIQTLSQTMAG